MLGVAMMALLGAGSPAAQDVYRYDDAAGRPVFTDRPPAGRAAERLAIPPSAAADSDPQQRLEDITETATLLKQDRMAREARRDELRREAARMAEEASTLQAAEEKAAERRVIGGGWFYPWAPGHGGWPGWKPGFRPPRHRPGWRPPPRPGLPPPQGGVLRPGPGSAGW